MPRRTSSVREILWREAGALLVAGGSLLPIETQACSVCVGWTEGKGLNGGFYWSALLLTALPFVVAAVIGAWLGYATRLSRPRRPHAAGAPEPREKR
jgi:hypothetical protein